MSHDLLRVTMDAELDAMTRYRQEEISEGPLVVEWEDTSQLLVSNTTDEQHGLVRQTHRCLTFRS